jgi:Flp pilus assembly secretin CpaC
MRAGFFIFLIALLFSAQPQAQVAAGSAVPGSENEKLRGQIQSTLRNEPSLTRCRLEVEVTDSEIVLSGSVPTAREKQTAHRLAQSYGNNRRVVDSKVNVQNAGGQSAAQGGQAQR